MKILLRKKEILFGECKWKEKANVLNILKELEEKAGFVDWNKSKREEIFVIFARLFSEKISEFNGKKVYCFELNYFKKI